MRRNLLLFASSPLVGQIGMLCHKKVLPRSLLSDSEGEPFMRSACAYSSTSSPCNVADDAAVMRMRTKSPTR